MKKGISPLVAAVLLIAATMSIAGVLAYWASSFVRGALPTVNVTTECQYADFNIYSCSYNKTDGTGTLVVTLHNYRTVPLKNFSVITVFPNASVGGPYSLTGGDLSPGAYRSYTRSNLPDFSRIIITTGNCPEVSRETDCGKS
jgi:flagellin-like protein